jgi:hypothetical protein
MHFQEKKHIKKQPLPQFKRYSTLQPIRNQTTGTTIIEYRLANILGEKF